VLEELSRAPRTMTSGLAWGIGSQTPGTENCTAVSGWATSIRRLMGTDSQSSTEKQQTHFGHFVLDASTNPIHSIGAWVITPGQNNQQPDIPAVVLEYAAPDGCQAPQRAGSRLPSLTRIVRSEGSDYYLSGFVHRRLMRRCVLIPAPSTRY
jgi:hypothetical protein